MRRTEAILVAALAVWLAGCALRGKQPVVKAPPPPPKPVVDTAPAPPPPPLSVPQTNVELPPPQPVNLDALAQLGPRTEPPPAVPASKPKRPAAPAGTTRTDTTSQPPPQPAAQPAEPAERAPIQEIVPPADLKRLQDETANFRREVKARLDLFQGRALNGSQKEMVDRITSFMKQSEEAEGRSDWRAARELSERAFGLARELAGGK